MQNNAFIRVDIKDGWSQHALAIATATDKMSRSIKNFEKQFNATSSQINGFTKKIGNASRSITEFNKKVNALDRAKVINLSNIITGDTKELAKASRAMKKFNQEFNALDNTKVLNLSNIITGNTKELPKASRAMKKFNQEFKEFNALDNTKVFNLSNIITGDTKELPKAARAMKKFNQEFKEFNALDNTKVLNISDRITGNATELDKAARAMKKFNQEFNKLDHTKVFNFSNLIKGDLMNQINQVNELNDKIKLLNAQVSGARVATGATRNVGSQKKGDRKAETSSVAERRILGGLLSTGIGTGVLRSSIVNARDFHIALYDVERQLGRTENLQDYINFIEEYSLKTGRANVEVTQQTAELLKTRKAGEGLNTIADRMDIATYATRQLKLDTEDAAQGVEILGSAYKMTTEELKGFFAQANAIEDVYGTVTGSDIVQILRRNVALLQNAKLLPKAQAVQLSAFAKANTSIEPTSVGTALSRIVSGSKGAFGGGYIKRAEQENKTLGEIILADAKLYGQLKTQTEKNEFTRSRLVGGNAKGNIRDIEVLNSIFIEGTKINMERVQSFLQLDKQYKQGTVSAATYSKELVKLTNAEQATVYSLQSTDDAIKSFNKSMQLLSVQHESTLGTISNSWKSISTVFADVALYPLFLDPLAKSLRVLTPAMTSFIRDEPLLSAAIGAVGVALLGLHGYITLFGGAKAIAAFGILKQLSAAFGIVAVGWEAGKLAVDAVTGNSTSSITPMIQKGVDNFADTSIGGKIVGSNFMQSVANSRLFGGSGSSMAIPTPLTQPQLQPKGEISVNVTVNGQAQVQTEVKRQDNMSLNLAPTTSRSPL